VNSARGIAVTVITQALKDQRSLAELIPALVTDHEDKGFIQALCYGVMRDYFRLDFYLQQLLQKPLKAKDTDIKAVLLIGLYQLFYMRVADHAAVHETVALTKTLKKDWARGLVNGVLRNAVRQREALQNACETKDVPCYSHPQWLIDKLQQTYPEAWQAILTANNQHPPMTLRVNLSKISRDNYLQQLTEQNVEAQAHSSVASAIVLAKPMDVNELPGFNEGLVSVQDAAAQWAAALLQCQAGQRVLDACAAPGGKTGHILESENNLQALIALDCEPARLQRVEDNLKRLQLSATLCTADAREPDTWWDGEMFDRILLDAPCSATGVIRRHPDIKILRQPDNIAAIVALQKALLQQLWPLLKPGGSLLYATCSVLPAENQQVIEWFLQHEATASLQPLTIPDAIDTGFGLQLLPGQQAMDGFFYCGLSRADTAC
tara:strand:+ start:137698 stop:139002 length:1305 start_codon:yes stop_codon:yes gene_type:complete